LIIVPEAAADTLMLLVKYPAGWVDTNANARAAVLESQPDRLIYSRAA
jgi:hypothetical protein